MANNSTVSFRQACDSYGAELPRARLTAAGPGDRSRLTSHDCPVLLPLLQVFGSQGDSLVSSQAAGQHEGQQGSIALSSLAVCIGCLPQGAGLVCREPVAKPDAVLLESLHAPEPAARSELSSPQSAASKPANRAETEIDRSRSQSPRFEVAPIPEDHNSIEGQPGCPSSTNRRTRRLRADSRAERRH